MRLRAAVDRDICVGNGICTEIAPGHFRLDAEGRALVAREVPAAADSLREAARACPTHAILLMDMDTRQLVQP